MRRVWQRGLAVGFLLVMLQACVPAGRAPAPAPAPAPGPGPGPVNESQVPPAGGPAIIPMEGDKPLMFRGDQLVAAPGAYLEFVRQIRPAKWEVVGDGLGTWAVDLERREAAPWQVGSLWYYYARPYALKDGRQVGLSGNGQQTDIDVAILIQDLQNERQEQVGTIKGGVVHIAPAGETIMAYTRINPDPNQWVGELWAYDWATQQHTKVADRGWPVGVLANGLAVAHEGEAYGALHLWRPGNPRADVLQPLSPDQVTPFRAAVSPDGQRVCYFQADPERSSWLDLLAPGKAYASPNRVSPAPNPTVSAVAEYDAATGKTAVLPLPLSGHASPIWFDQQGNCMVSLVEGLLARVEAGKLAVLARSDGGSMRFIGWEGGRPVVAVGSGGEKPVRLSADGKAELWPEPFAWGGYVILDWSAGEARALDLPTGKWYRVTGGLAYSAALRPAVLDGAGGWLVVQVQNQPQQVYQVMKVEPVH